MDGNLPSAERSRSRVVSARAGVLGVGVLVAAVIAALLATATPAGSNTPVYGELGTLDLFAGPSSGDGVDFVPIGAATPTLTESFTAASKGRLVESGPDLVVLTPEGPAQGQLPYTGLKDHEIGVRSKGDGTGTPASRVDFDETLTLALGSDLPGEYAWYAQIALSAKFGADFTVEYLDDEGVWTVGDSFSCTLNDCGPDSGGDRILLTVGDGTSATLFTAVRISVTAASGGAVSLIDSPLESGRPSQPGGPTLLDTYFDIVEEFSGELACEGGPVGGETVATQTVDDLSSDFTRLSVDLDVAVEDFPLDIQGDLPALKSGNVADDCGTLIPFNQDIDTTSDTITFEPENPELVGVYRGDLTFPAGTSGADFFLALQSDYGTGINDLEPCTAGDVAAPEVGDEDAASQLAGFFPEMGDNGNYPRLPLDPNDPDGTAATNVSCVVSYNTTAGGDEHWVVYLIFDPRYF